MNSSHRVIGKNGKLVSYGGGLWRKQHLLDLEREHAAGQRRDNLPAPGTPGDKIHPRHAQQLA